MKLYLETKYHRLIPYRATNGNLDGIEYQKDFLGNPYLYDRFGKVRGKLICGIPHLLSPLKREDQRELDDLLSMRRG